LEAFIPAAQMLALRIMWVEKEVHQISPHMVVVAALRDTVEMAEMVDI
jgi:hypothetical protein